MLDTISILTNNNENHKDEILKLIKNSDEIIFAVGFLKDSGFNNLKDNLNGFLRKNKTKSKFYIGTGFGETSPRALLELHKLLKRKPEHQLSICTPDAGIFHPKIYFFRKGDRVTVITGSANLTESGMKINNEVSNKIESTIKSEYSVKILNYFNNLSKTYDVENIEELIDEYKNDLEKHNQAYYNPKFRFRPRGNRNKEVKIDLPRLVEYYKYYIESDDFIEPIERENKYLLAKINLKKIVDLKNPTLKDFHDLFGPLVGHSGYQKLWNSGSIHRHTHKTLKYISGFQEIVRTAQENIDCKVDITFDKVMAVLKEKRKKEEIFGIGLNIIAEILMSYHPNKFANINDNPISSLKLLGKEFKSINSFKGNDYKEYVDLLNEIKERLKINSFLEVDSFLNYVYWNLLEE